MPKRDLGACGSDKKVTEKNEVLLHEGDGLMSVDRLTKCKNAVCMIRCETRCPNTGERLRKYVIEWNIIPVVNVFISFVF